MANRGSKARSITAGTQPNLGNRKVRAVIDAARELFVERKLVAPSMDLIASTAGVSKATVYAYFPSREQLLATLIEHEMQSRGLGVIWDTEADRGDIETSLRGIATQLMDFYLRLHYEDRAFHRLIEDLAHSHPGLGLRFFAAGPAKTREQFASFLREADSKGLLSVPDIDLAVIQFLSLIHGDLRLRGMLSMPLPSRRQLNSFIEGGVRVFLAAYAPVAARGRHRH